MTLYKVYFNQDEAAEEKSALRSQRRPSKNLIKIDVDLKELKESSVSKGAFNSSLGLRNFAGEVANSVLVNENGDVMVNSAKLNPNSVSVVEKRLTMIDSKTRQAESQIYNQNKKSIATKRKTCLGKPYQLNVSVVEKASPINNLIGLTGNEEDQVYEMFEVFLEFSAICKFTKDKKDPIIWEIPFSDAQKLTGCKETHDMARYLIANTDVVENRMLISTTALIPVQQRNVVLVNERFIRALQQRIRDIQLAKRKVRCMKEIEAINTNNSILFEKTNMREQDYHINVKNVGLRNYLYQAWGTEDYLKYEYEAREGEISAHKIGNDKKAIKDAVVASLARLNLEWNSNSQKLVLTMKANVEKTD